MARRVRMLAVVLGVLGAAVLAASCGTKTARPTVNKTDVRIQSERVRELALKREFEYKDRLNRLGYLLRHANADLCGRKTVRSLGVSIDSAENLAPDWRPTVATVMGITSDQPSIFAVAPGSPGDKAGLRVGDEILTYNGRSVPSGEAGRKDLREWMYQDFRRTAKDDAKTGADNATAADKQTEKAADKDADKAAAQPESALAVPEVDATPTPFVKPANALDPVTVQLGVRRRGLISYIDVQAEAVCRYPLVLVYTDEVNACADGKVIYVNTGLLRLLTDDGQLMLILGHEMAHNVMGHIEQDKQNVALGQLADAIVTFFTGGPSGAFTDASRMVNDANSIPMEEEADYVGLYFSARTGTDISHVRELWELMAVEHPGAIGRPGTDHPMDEFRSLFLEKTVAEIEAKRAQGQPLVPNIQEGATAPWDADDDNATSEEP
ncbi:MAG: M48 family metalloprotease [Desulfovibrionaceae bacterium]